MCLFYALMLTSISINAISLVSSNVIAVKCDFRKHTNGCDPSTGAKCDSTINTCICREGLIRLKDGSCLEPKMIGEDCSSSAQCMVDKSGCFATSAALDRWQCQCEPQYWLKVSAEERNGRRPKQSCEQRLSYGQSCHNSNQCSEQLVCSPSEHRCVCDTDFEFNSNENKCFHKNYTKCSDGEEWSQHLNKCVERVHYSNRGTSGGGSGARAGMGGRASGSKGWFGDNAAHSIQCYANVYLYSIVLLAIALLDIKRIAFTISY